MSTSGIKVTPIGSSNLDSLPNNFTNIAVATPYTSVAKVNGTWENLSGFTVLLEKELVISIGSVTADNILNAMEKLSTIQITGTVTGQINAYSNISLTVTVNNTVYNVPSINSDGTWSIGVSGADLSLDTVVLVESTSVYQGQTYNFTGFTSYTVDIVGVGTVVISSIATDNDVNYDESLLPTLPVTGYVTGEVQPGTSIRVLANGANFLRHCSSKSNMDSEC